MTPALVATWYIAVASAPLFCGGLYNTAEVWISLPFDEYGETWECGDLIAVWFVEENELLLTRVQDAGPFGRNCVLQADGSCIRIGVDVPRHVYLAEGVLSAQVTVYNVTAEVRRVGVQ